MANLVEIKKEPILISSTIVKFEQPDFIYLPISGYNLNIQKNAKVNIGTEVFKNANTSIYSSISGTVKAIKNMTCEKGKEEFLEIENDFQELRELEPSSKKSLAKTSKEEIIQKFSKVLGHNIEIRKNFILNCLDDEPYILTENFYLMNYCEEFLDFLDELIAKFKLEKVVLCVKSTSSENISKLTSMLGMYPAIELQVCPDLYLLGREEFLLNYLGLLKDETSIITAEDFRTSYNYIKRNRHTSTKFITISGNGVKNPAVVKVKIGTKLFDIIKENFDVLEDIIYLANGLMKGTSINLDDFVITSDLKGIIIMKREEKNESSCFHCGSCTRICPYGLNPTLLKYKKYRLKVENICTKCGLCSYICPSNIDFNKFWEGDNNHE